MAEAVRVRQGQASARRRQILDAARKLFARNGFHATSIRDVHREVGVSDGLLYHYFPSKIDLLHAVLEEAFAHMAHKRLAADVPPGTPVPQILVESARRVWQRWTSMEDVMRILLSHHQVLTEAGDFSLAATFVRSQGGLADLLAARIRAGEMRPMDPVLAARQFINQLLGLYVFQVVVGGEQVSHIDPEEYFRQTADTLWNGWKAAPEGIEGEPR